MGHCRPKYLCRSHRWPVPSPDDHAHIARKVRHLDNDVQSIYEMLARIEATQNRHGNRLGEITTTIGEMDGKLDAILALLRER